MLEHSLVEWIFLFYFYCFFGWCFESTYVSLKEHKFINRGFMRGPFLPLYGSGAIMMMLVIVPCKENPILIYLAGCLGATVLELITGIAMEALFKVRYWDYSYKKIHYKGYICLSSTIAWGGLTLLMNYCLQPFVSKWIEKIPGQVIDYMTLFITFWVCVDFALSFKAAMDLRNLLVKMEHARKELAYLQRRLDERAEEWKEGLKENIRDNIESRKEDLLEKKDALMNSMEQRMERVKYNLSKILQANPTMTSKRFEESMNRLKERILRYRDKDDETELK